MADAQRERMARFREACPAWADRYAIWEIRSRELVVCFQRGAIADTLREVETYAARVREDVVDVFEEGLIVRAAYRRFLELDVPSLVVVVEDLED